MTPVWPATLQLAHQRDHGGILLGVAAPTPAFLTISYLPLAGGLELGHKSRFFQLRKCARYLPHGYLEGVVGVGEVVAAGRQHAHSPRYQCDDPQLLPLALMCIVAFPLLERRKLVIRE
jgi:hypothetical protein